MNTALFEVPCNDPILGNDTVKFYFAVLGTFQWMLGSGSLKNLRRPQRPTSPVDDIEQLDEEIMMHPERDHGKDHQKTWARLSNKLIEAWVIQARMSS